MKIRPRALALTLAFGLVGLGLAGCASDPIAANAADTLTYSYADPYYTYDSDWWPDWDYGWWVGRYHGFRHSGAFHFHGGHHFGHHR